MVRGDSVTISFRLNLNREEDTEIWNFLTGDALEACFGDKSKCIKSAMIRMIHGIKQDEREKHLVVEMNTRMDVIQNAMTGEADRIINAVKLIVKEEVERIAGIQSERDKTMPHTDSKRHHHCRCENVERGNHEAPARPQRHKGEVGYYA